MDNTGIIDECAKAGGQIKQVIPIGTIAGKAGYVGDQNDTDLFDTNLGDKGLKANALKRTGAGFSQIIVNDFDEILRPAKSAGVLDEPVLHVFAFQIVLDLLHRGLAYIDNGKAMAMMRLYFGSEISAQVHAPPPDPEDSSEA
jgi:hypothetical protein